MEPEKREYHLPVKLTGWIRVEDDADEYAAQRGEPLAVTGIDVTTDSIELQGTGRGAFEAENGTVLRELTTAETLALSARGLEGGIHTITKVEVDGFRLFSEDA